MRNHHFVVLAVILSVADAFHTQRPVPPKTCSSALFMGRAAAVRAATKSKTDGKKAKVNGVFGKKIIMAVKQGGSPDPVANTILRDVIKAAKANSVPADVSCVVVCASSCALWAIIFEYCTCMEAEADPAQVTLSVG